jgi:hypothetical protein
LKSDSLLKIEPFLINATEPTLKVSQENFLHKRKMISFPNPSLSSINITNPLKNNENEKIEVYDTNGRKVLEKAIIENGKNVNLSRV